MQCMRRSSGIDVQLHSCMQAYVVHATFQRHHTPGKRARLREEALWLPEAPEYFAADRLLAYSNGVADYVAALDAAAAAPLPDLLKHLHAMAYQLAALRDAFGVARALNRTLVCAARLPGAHRLYCMHAAHARALTRHGCAQVLPRFVCYCDQDWYASVLTACRMDGSDLALPFTCPLDVLLNPDALERSGVGAFRMAAYLADARTPARITQSEERVTVLRSRAAASRAHTRRNGAGAAIAAGATAAELQAALHDLHAVHVLRLEGLQPGVFGGWRGEGGATENSRLDREFTAAVGDDAKWCCRCARLLKARALAVFAKLRCESAMHAAASSRSRCRGSPGRIGCQPRSQAHPVATGQSPSTHSPRIALVSRQETLASSMSTSCPVKTTRATFSRRTGAFPTACRWCCGRPAGSS
jgi:hypothetical protein